jgi:hypothetical protein
VSMVPPMSRFHPSARAVVDFGALHSSIEQRLRPERGASSE